MFSFIHLIEKWTIVYIFKVFYILCKGVEIPPFIMLCLKYLAKPWFVVQPVSIPTSKHMFNVWKCLFTFWTLVYQMQFNKMYKHLYLFIIVISSCYKMHLSAINDWSVKYFFYRLFNLKSLKRYILYIAYLNSPCLKKSIIL